MPAFTRSTHGFSVVELLVSVAIGMLALVFATRLITGSEQSKQSALGGSDAMQSGMLAMFSISGDARQAGFGLNDSLLVGCNTHFSDSAGYVMAKAERGATTVQPLAPAIIEANPDGSDRISLYSGSAIGGTGTLRVVSDYIGGTRINVDRRPYYGFASGDVVVVAPEDKNGDCALAQISAEPGSEPFVMVAGGSNFRYNSGALGSHFKGSGARIFNLGPATALSFHTWSVSDGFLQLRATDMNGASAAPVTVADNIVAIKAQYGFDTRTGSAFGTRTSLAVGRWSSSMIDADGDGEVGGAGDYAHLAALRIAVIARSKTAQRPAAGSACNASTDEPTVFASAEPAGATTEPVSVPVAVAGDANDWQCYHYRAFETVVALRNADWRP